MYLPDMFSLTLALSTAAVAGLVGAFALMKRMTLAGDVISHIAIPGLAIAFLLHINPVIGAFVALVIGSLLIWKLEGKDLGSETAIGVIFTAAVAVGALLASDEELVDALFGGFTNMSPIEFAIGMGLAAMIGLFIYFFKNRLVLSLFSPDLAQTTGMNVKLLNLGYLLAFSMTALLGIRFLGGLLVGALIIIPAAIGRQLTHTLRAFLIASSLSAIAVTALGFVVTAYYPNLALGPVIVTIAAIAFGMSLLKKKA